MKILTKMVDIRVSNPDNGIQSILDETKKVEKPPKTPKNITGDELIEELEKLQISG